MTSTCHRRERSIGGRPTLAGAALGFVCAAAGFCRGQVGSGDAQGAAAAWAADLAQARTFVVVWQRPMTLSGNRGDGSPVAGTYTFERRVSVRWPDCLRIEEHAIDMVGMKPEDELGLRHAIDQTTVLTPAHEVFYVRSDGLDVKSGGQHTLEESLGRVVRDSPVAVALWLGGADGRAALARSTATENTLRVPLASAQEALLQINNGRAQLTSIRSTAGTGPGWQEVYGGYATLTPSLPAMPTTRTSTLVLENAKPVANTSTLVQHEFGVPLGDEVFQPPLRPA